MKPTIAIPALAIALLAPAAAAHGATLTLDRQCYIEGQTMAISGTGWVPGSQWAVRADQLYGFGTADPSGNFATTEEMAPIVASQSNKPKTFTLSGEQDGTAITSTTFQSVNLVGRPKNTNGKPTGSVKWLFGGLFLGKSIYIHVKRGSKVYTSRAGKAKGPCGTLTKRLKRLPGVPASKIRNGVYHVLIDNRKKFKKGGLQTGGDITVYTRPA